MAFLKPKQPTLSPVPSPSQFLTPTNQPIQGTTAAAGSQTPTFLGLAALPPPSQANAGGKTLLGQ